MKKFILNVASLLAVAAVGSYPLLAGSASMDSTLAAPPMRAASDLPVLYGSVIYADNFVSGSEVGLYDVPTSDDSFHLKFYGPSAYGGGVYRDGVYYTVNYSSATGSIESTVDGYDFETGAKLYSVTHDHTIIGHMALDPVSNEIYGITFRPEMGGYMLSKIDFLPGEVSVERIKNLDYLWAAFAIDGTGQFYGITKKNISYDDGEVANLYSIDRTTGALTFIGKTGGQPVHNTDATIDPRTNRMFWCTHGPIYGGRLLEVNLQTAATTEITTFANGQQVTGLFIPTGAAAADAPAACTNFSVTSDSPEMKCVLTLDTPSTLFDGETPGSGDLYVKVMVDSDQVANQKVEWGKRVSVPVNLTGMEPGLYNFTIIASNANGNGPKAYLNNVFVGPDAPAATTATLEYADGKMNLSWLPVEGSAHGGYIDADNITYTVLRADGTMAASGLKTTSWSEQITMPTTVEEVYYEVVTVTPGFKSDPARSNIVILGDFSVPYASDFAGNPTLKYFTVIDANNDGITWMPDGVKMKCGHNQYQSMDDWLISPPLHLEADVPYELKFAANCYMSNSPERIEVKYGASNTVAAMTDVVLEPTKITNTQKDPKQFECFIVPETTGTYYIGFHGISDAYMYQLYVSDFTVEVSESADNPGAPTELTVVPDESSALKAMISFKTPTKTISRKPLSSLTKAEVYRNGSLVKTFDNPALGATLSYEDVVTSNGTYEYSVVAYNEEGKGMAASASTFIGQDVPAAPAAVNISRTNVAGEVIVSWPAVTTDCNGKPIYGDVKYSIVKVATDGSRSVLADGITGDSYTYTATREGNQIFAQCEVNAVSNAGAGEATLSAIIPVGTPYSNFGESFPGGAPSMIWGETRYNEDTRWEVYTEESGYPSADGDNGFAAFYGMARGEQAMLYSGLISLEGVENPGLTFYLYNNATEASPNRNILRIMLRDGNSLDWQPVFDKSIADAINGNEEWTKVTVNLSEFIGHDIQIALVGEAVNYRYFFIDDITVATLPDCDLSAAKITAPVSVKTNTDFTITVKVENQGSKEVENYSVSLYSNGSLYETKECAKLAAGADCNVDFTLHMAADAKAQVKYYAEVKATGDADSGNNRTSAVLIRPAYSGLPGATALTLTPTDKGANLKWEAAKAQSASGEAVTEDFENGDGFASTFGNWIFVDEDNSPVSGPKDYDIPNVEYGITTGSFWVWDMQQLPSSEFDAHSGQKFLFSLFRKDGGQADDWAISPELSGDAQTVSFWAKSVESAYPEKLEVYYSEGGTQVADFVKVTGVGGTVPSRWTEYKAKLPAGAKRFAIRSCAADALMLLVDDVTFVPADVLFGAVFNGYDVYRNNVKQTASPIAECSYSDTGLVEKESYRYSVVAVYDIAVAEPSNNVTFVFDPASVNTVASTEVKVNAADGYIAISGAEGHEVMIITEGGMILYGGTPTADLRIAAEQGVYLVRVAGMTKKIILK